MEKEEKKLYLLWKKYIDVPIYRVSPLCDRKNILKNGIDPVKDPYESIKPKIKAFAKILKNLEKKRQIFLFRWGEKEITGVDAIKITLNDLSKPYVDFSPSKESLEYYSKLRGGAVTANIMRIVKRFIEVKPDLSENEWKIVFFLHKWVTNRECRNFSFYVQGSSKIFETALFQLRGTNKKRKRVKLQLVYYESPFGRFEHFKRIIKKQGFRKYSFRLKNKLFYLRVREKISVKEINLI